MRIRLLGQRLIIILTSFSLILLNATLPPDEAQAHSITPSSTPSPPPPYLEYQVYGGSVITDLTMPPVLPNGSGDYTEIYTEHNLCFLIASGQVDEVWIWAGNGDGITKGNLWEWTTSGPNWYGDAPNCGKVVTTMTFNYLREVDVALESYNHRLEGFFTHYFACDLSTATWPWAGSTTTPFSQCGNLLSDRYGFVARPFAGNNQIAGCGDAHHPPNILGNQEYVYNDTTTVETICPSWSQDGSALPVSLNCQAWGCTHWGFHLWWMQNVPGFDNTNKDRNGNLQPNWLSYLFGTPFTQFRIYLPLILNQFTSNSSKMEQHPPLFALDPQSGVATAPETELSLTNRLPVSEKAALHSPSSLASQPAVTTRTVYVLYYPGYGGTPRADVNLLTTELIGLLKDATIYHGYEYSKLYGTFYGQDGKSYAGQGCTTGAVPDNIHIRLDGVKTDVQATSYRVDDTAGGGVWATPCNPVSNWLLYVNSTSPGQADLYFKPFRVAPDGTIYAVKIQYSDGTNQIVDVVGTQVQP